MFNLLKTNLTRLKKVFSKTQALFGKRILTLFQKPLSEDTLESLEEILYEADLGSECVQAFINHIQSYAKTTPNASPQELIESMKTFAKSLLTQPPKIPLKSQETSPHVILVVGVNGSGKTTTVAKLGHHFQKQGKSVLLAAGDTFRAAAIDQLDIWAKRSQIPCIKGIKGGDPSAVMHDALSAALSRKIDLVIGDTAGRLQSKTDLMQELAKMTRVCGQLIPNAPHEILLVLDVTTGQNAVDQAKVFNQFAPLTSLILTKLDGSAKGGMALSLYHQMGIPISFMGIGEKIDDFIPFDIENYVEALFPKSF